MATVCKQGDRNHRFYPEDHIDLIRVEASPNAGSCSCGSDGWVLQGYAECPAGAALMSAGTPADMADIFKAICTNLDGSGNVDPATISIRCVGVVPAEANCDDGIDNDGNGLIDCADPACSSEPACQALLLNPACSDCKSKMCKNEPACKKGNKS